MEISKKQKEAIKMLDKFITEHKLYEIKQSDGLEDNIKIVLYLIEKLQKENEELEEINNELEAEKNEAIRRYNFETIPIKKIKDKIEELENQMEKDKVDDFGIHSIGWSILDYIVECLKSLLQEGDDK